MAQPLHRREWALFDSWLIWRRTGLLCASRLGLLGRRAGPSHTRPASAGHAHARSSARAGPFFNSGQILHASQCPGRARFFIFGEKTEPACKRPMRKRAIPPCATCMLLPVIALRLGLVAGPAVAAPAPATHDRAAPATSVSLSVPASSSTSPGPPDGRRLQQRRGLRAAGRVQRRRRVRVRRRLRGSPLRDAGPRAGAGGRGPAPAQQLARTGAPRSCATASSGDQRGRPVAPVQQRLRRLRFGRLDHRLADRPRDVARVRRGAVPTDGPGCGAVGGAQPASGAGARWEVLAAGQLRRARCGLPG